MVECFSEAEAASVRIVASHQRMQTRGRREKQRRKKEKKEMRIRRKFTESGTLVGWSVIWRLFQGLNVV